MQYRTGGITTSMYCNLPIVIKKSNHSKRSKAAFIQSLEKKRRKSKKKYKTAKERVLSG